VRNLHFGFGVPGATVRQDLWDPTSYLSASDFVGSFPQPA